METENSEWKETHRPLFGRSYRFIQLAKSAREATVHKKLWDQLLFEAILEMQNLKMFTDVLEEIEKVLIEMNLDTKHRMKFLFLFGKLRSLGECDDY